VYRSGYKFLGSESHVDDLYDVPEKESNSFLKCSDGTSLVWVSSNFEDVNELYETSDENISSTSSTNYIEKLSLEQTLEGGIYRIGWFFEWTMSNSSHKFKGRVQLNDSTILSEMTGISQPGGSSYYFTASGFIYQNLSPGTNYIDIDFCSSHSSKTAYIRRVRLELWRVS